MGKAKKLQVTVSRRSPLVLAHFVAFEGNASAEAVRLMELGLRAESLTKLIYNAVQDAMRDLPLTSSASVDDSSGGEDAQAAARLGGAVGGYWDEGD